MANQNKYNQEDADKIFRIYKESKYFVADDRDEIDQIEAVRVQETMVTATLYLLMNTLHSIYNNKWNGEKCDDNTTIDYILHDYMSFEDSSNYIICTYGWFVVSLNILEDLGIIKFKQNGEDTATINHKLMVFADFNTKLVDIITFDEAELDHLLGIRTDTGWTIDKTIKLLQKSSPETFELMVGQVLNDQTISKLQKDGKIIVLTDIICTLRSNYYSWMKGIYTRDNEGTLVWMQLNTISNTHNSLKNIAWALDVLHHADVIQYNPLVIDKPEGMILRIGDLASTRITTYILFREDKLAKWVETEADKTDCGDLHRDDGYTRLGTLEPLMWYRPITGGDSL